MQKWEEWEYMQKWEYMELLAGPRTWQDSAGQAGETPSIGTASLERWWSVTPILNELGTEGWELVGIAPYSTHAFSGFRLFFKRPLTT